MKKKLSGLLAVSMLAMMFTTIACAAQDLGIGENLSGDLGPIQTPVQSVLGVIQVIGFVVAIVMVMYVGIKYLAAGAGQKAEVKSTMVPMLVGAAMVGLAPTLVKWIFGIFA